ncbi:MAG: glycosyltransferase [Patescibacteria group bacterium]
MENYPFISVIIPARNEEALIGECLKNLQQLNYPKDRLEIIISDGLSTDKTAEIVKTYGAKIVVNKFQTVAPGRNIGFQHSQGDLVAFSDADCLMDKNWLSNALKYFQDESVAGVGGPSLSPQDESVFGRAVRFLFLCGSLISGSIYVTDSKKTKIVKSIPGCNAIYKRVALEKVMPVDETLLTGDDVEMNYQLISRGYKVLYVPDVTVWHYRRDNPKKFWKQIYRYAIGRLQMAKRHRDAASPIHIISGLALPIFIFLMIFSFILNPLYPLFLTGAIIIALAIFSGLSLIEERSFKVVLNVFLATIIFIFAWSLGFLREFIRFSPSTKKSR